MKIALVTPPLAGHRERGSGVYFNNLDKEMSKIGDGTNVIVVKLGQDLSGFDMVHYPYFDPFFLTLPLIKTIKRIVTVHDLIPLKYPQNFPTGVATVTFWINRADDNLRNIIRCETGWKIYAASSGGIRVDNSSATYTKTNVLGTGKWYYVAVVSYNSTSSEIYVNGTSVATSNGIGFDACAISTIRITI